MLKFLNYFFLFFIILFYIVLINKIFELENKITLLERKSVTYVDRYNIQQRAEYVDYRLQELNFIANSILTLGNIVGKTTDEIDSMFFYNQKLEYLE
jgi:hypothetical protein